MHWIIHFNDVSLTFLEELTSSSSSITMKTGKKRKEWKQIYLSSIISPTLLGFSHSFVVTLSRRALPNGVWIAVTTDVCIIFYPNFFKTFAQRAPSLGEHLWKSSLKMHSPPWYLLCTSKTLLATIHYSLTKCRYNYTGFLGSSAGKESACNAGDLGLIPGPSPGEGIDYSLQSSWLENTHGHRSLVGYSSWGRKELHTNERLSTAQDSIYYCTFTLFLQLPLKGLMLKPKLQYFG